MNRALNVPIKFLAAGLLGLLLAACSGGQSARVASTGSAPAATSAGEIDAIVQLLDQGREGPAKKRISAALKRSPLNPSLMLLRDSVSRKPRDLLGPDSYPYTAQSGDTMAGLAQRFLGNRLKFYQLSRYNDIDQPSSLRAGQVLNIPGRPAPAAPQNADRRPAPALPARDKPKNAAAPAAAPAVAAPARPAANPAAANQARSAGLAALNAGQPARAVALLSRAAALDPGNAVIGRDLARARRIAATVGAK